MPEICSEGWLKKAERICSPNAGDRPDEGDISLLVIHNISLPPGQFGGGYIQQFFTNTLPCEAHPYFSEIGHLQVSAHLLIERSGHMIQFVPFTKRAWHAGVSQFEGRENCNDFSIGIELEGTDDSPFMPQQYTALSEVTKLLMRYYPQITPERIAGHSDIAPGRKTDPGPAFDWALFRQLLGQ